LNGACAKLNRIAARKNDEDERAIAGRSLEDLPEGEWPSCVEERATFMAPFDLVHVKRHALSDRDPRHYGHFLPTPQRYPAYAAALVPFLWLMREQIAYKRDLLEIDVDPEREPDLGYHTNWVHEAQNQRSLLDAFASHIQIEQSLCFFYAKHVPFVEGTGRILIGVGRVNGLGGLIEYKREGEGPAGMVWERPMQHSIRPQGKDGFLVPYSEVLHQASEDPSLNIEHYVAKAPSEHWDEFSYASELVTHDGAIAALLSLESALGRMEDELGIATGWQQQWLRDELVRLWKVRGPFPGLGAVLFAFGLSRGIFVAHALQQKAGENADAWPLVDRAFADPAGLLPDELRRDFAELAPTWKRLPAGRRSYLRLLSRFELTAEKAEALYEEGSRRRRGWGGTDAEILQNPYRIVELSRHDPEGVKLLAVDRGVFPEDIVRLLHPLEAPSGLDSAADLRRVRAFTISALEEAALAGHTLLSKDRVVEEIRSFPVRPECPVTGDMLAAWVSEMAPEVVDAVTNRETALQLGRYKIIGELVRKQVLGRIGGQRHAVACDWAYLIQERFGPSSDSEEPRAREEKTAALKELAECRFSVLAGPAGTGKTTILGILCSQPEIRDEGILLLAPTGKARVRMQELAGANATRAYTIAQFLNQHGRYDARAGRYVMGDRPKATGFGTVIVDEASMLTEDMIGALLDAVQGVKRFVFVGDPSQLPPIGAGRPFVDIISHVRPDEYQNSFPRVAPGYAELTIERRQVAADRPDLRLARWFSMTPPSAGEDDIFFAGANEHARLRFVEWQNPEEFHDALTTILVEELGLASRDDLRGFNLSLGATAKDEYEYFNRTRDDGTGAVRKVEAWQILSPLRGMPIGVGDINRNIHERFRSGFLTLASQRFRPIPKPMGAERIVYGDKVINLRNHRRDGKKVYPQERALGYLANGEIGIAVGLWSSGKNPRILKVEFSSQRGFTYDFYGSDFREEADPSLELAYALTIHKAQGSQFDLVILVVPEAHPILSRELLYTALTRHQARIVVMHQGPRANLKAMAAPDLSETARRMTNLMRECRMLEIPRAKGSVFLQEGLIHRTSKGLAVRSKSELVIAEALTHAGVPFEYEKPLSLGGTTRFPDFTIEDEISGRTFYWEHLGLLHRGDYRLAWEAKRKWYQANGVLPLEAGVGPMGALIETRDEPNGSLDSMKISRIIEGVLRG
jgi:hypothetical protein